MGRSILIRWAGRHQRKAWESLCADYRRRIEMEVPVEDQMVKARGSADDPSRRAKEAEALLSSLPEPCWIIALDRRGRARDSESFAAELARLREEWPHPVAFVLGSDLGLAPEMLERARSVLSFGPMVYGHELARLVLYEQIYRALCLQRGIKYHRRLSGRR
ncbi:MAG: 23S rRNA (pseudouridine(1915)-N(3))-methyltransferase RlmH [Holophagales bacterium]|nr:23S rRNA (pseudouridine(1915)-N(3))-methyltransferase RlmH [Holophagales bacterium]